MELASWCRDNPWFLRLTADHGPKNFRHGERRPANSDVARKLLKAKAFIHPPRAPASNQRFVDRGRRFGLNEIWTNVRSSPLPMRKPEGGDATGDRQNCRASGEGSKCWTSF